MSALPPRGRAEGAKRPSTDARGGTAARRSRSDRARTRRGQHHTSASIASACCAKPSWWSTPATRCAAWRAIGRRCTGS